VYFWKDKTTEKTSRKGKTIKKANKLPQRLLPSETKLPTASSPVELLKKAKVSLIKLSPICDRILENLPFGHKQTSEKIQLKILAIFLNKEFFLDFDTVTIKPTYYEISHQKLHFPRRYG